MAQTNPPSEEPREEAPQAMLFDGWGYVPLPKRESVDPAAKTETNAERAPA